MRIYIAGSLRLNKIFTEHKDLIKPFHRLDSYFYLKQKELREVRPNVESFFLDSGAFSAWSKGETINLDEYIDFIKRNSEYLDCYATLDDISSVETTKKNTEYMEEAGLNPVTVFHYGEPWNILQELIERYKYIALGGMVPIPTKKLEVWLDECFSRICDKNGQPLLKVHGFGLTTMSLMIKYPWYSVDSTSAVMSSAMGRIILPTGKDMDLGKESLPSLQEKEYLSNLGYEYSMLKQDYIIRQVFNINSYCKIEKDITESSPTFIMKQQHLL